MLIDVYDQGPKYYSCYDFYKPVKDPNAWLKCPICKLKPLIWEFDNGRQTACGCGMSPADHVIIYAASMNSIYNKDYNIVYAESEGSTSARKKEYDPEELKNNWNHWCETGEILFDPKKKE